MNDISIDVNVIVNELLQKVADLTKESAVKSAQLEALKKQIEVLTPKGDE